MEKLRQKERKTEWKPLENVENEVKLCSAAHLTGAMERKLGDFSGAESVPPDAESSTPGVLFVC